MGDLSFEVTVDHSESTLVVSVGGEADLATSTEPVECVQTNADRDVVLDLSGVAHGSGHALRA
jgi:anti-anti-sigma regulatory factor